MKRTDDRRGILWTWVAVAACWTAAFCLVCRLSASAMPGIDGNDAVTAAGKVAGGSRIAFGAHFYQTADVYFHKGVPCATKRAAEGSLFRSLADRISPPAHAHASGGELREIMPWLRLAVLSNPHDVEAYLVAVFWLRQQPGQTELALDVLREAQQNNPKDYRVYLERGRILLAANRMEEAGKAFDAGLAFWPGGEEPGSEEALLGRRNLLLHRALIYEAEGNGAAAVAALSDILRLYPASPGVAERIEALRRGEPPAVSAGRVLAILLDEDNHLRRECHREDTPEHE